MVFNTKVLNKNSIHVFKYKLKMKNLSYWNKCQNQVNKIFYLFILTIGCVWVKKGVVKKMYWKQKYHNKLLVNASKNISIIIFSSID
jgi:hypothetical protein